MNPATKGTQPDRLEELSRIITLTAFVIALFALLAAPLLALQWRQEPFPGMLLNPNLVVNGRIKNGWPAREAGIGPPARIIRVAGVPVANTDDFRSVISTQEIGAEVPIFTRQPDGSVGLFPAIELIEVPTGDFYVLFWLPYLVSLAYFGIALWIYGTSGQTRPGRALSFFCVSVAITVGLLFESHSTHLGDELWALALSGIGGALFSLSLRFPVEWRPVTKHPWILSVPYLVSLGLAGWAIWALHQSDQPWLFLQTRTVTYRFISLGALFFFAVTFIQARISARSSVRRQARLVLFGSLLAFLPIIAWFTAPLVGLTFSFNSVTLLPGLVLFPLTVGTAILRYRLLEFDSLLNRAIVYGLLTAVLAGVVAAAIGLSQRLFILITGERSDIAIIMTTLLVVSAFTPIKNRIQNWVDRQFREMPAADLRKLGEAVESHVRMTDHELLGDHFVNQAATSLNAESAALFIDQVERLVLKNSFGDWRGDAMISVPIIHAGRRIGLIQLGPRRNGKPYLRYEVDSLAKVAEQVGKVLAMPAFEKQTVDGGG